MSSNGHTLSIRKATITILTVKSLVLPEARNAYRQEVAELLASSTPPSNNQERWDNIVKATTTAAKNCIGLKSRAKQSTNAEVVKLSVEQKRIREQIDCCKNIEESHRLRCMRNIKLRRIHDALRTEKSSRIEEKVESIEREKNDSKQILSVIKEMQREKTKVPLLIKTSDKNLTRKRC